MTTLKNCFDVYVQEALHFTGWVFSTVAIIFCLLWYGCGMPIPHIPGHSFLELFGERLKTDLNPGYLPASVSVVVIALAFFSNSSLFGRLMGHDLGLTISETFFVLLGVWFFAGIAMSVSFGVQEGLTQLRGLIAISSIVGAFISLLLCTSTRRLR